VKKLKMSMPYVAAALILLAGVFGSRLISYIFPMYLDEIKVYDKTSGAGALYVGDEELLIWPWNGYSETDVREVEADGWTEEMTRVIQEIGAQLGAPGTFPGARSQTTPTWKMDDKNFMYLKDYTYTGMDGREYTCDVAWEGGVGGLVYYHNIAVDMEKGTDAMREAAVEEMKKWREPVLLYPEEYVEAEGTDREYMTEMTTGESYGTLLTDFLEVYWGIGELEFEVGEYENFEMRDRVVNLLINANEDILAYGNELLAVYSGDEMGTMIVYYSPAEERITGFSMKIVW